MGGSESGDGRDETRVERYDRNWSELLQELRITQTGVQILAGFLLTLPFSQRFGELDQGYRTLFLVTFCGAVTATTLFIAPVAVHRFLFRRHEKDVVVEIGNRTAQLGMTALGATLVCVVALIFGVVLGTTAALIAAGLVLLLFLTVWVALPLVALARAEREDRGAHSAA